MLNPGFLVGETQFYRLPLRDKNHFGNPFSTHIQPLTGLLGRENRCDIGTKTIGSTIA